jgi:hypothetical protein
MSEKRMLADVLWEAANKRLCATGGGMDGLARTEMRFSCNSIFRALNLKPSPDSMDGLFQLPLAVKNFLRCLGCDPYEDGYFQGLPPSEQQGVRYMWLLLAMHVAEDEGITV